MTQQQENNTPSEWHETTVGEFAPFTYGKSLKAKDRNPDGNVPVFGSNGIVGYHDAALTAGPTVIIGRKGTAGAVHYSPEPCWPIDTTFFITGDDPHLIRFKHYALGAIGLPDMNTDSAVPGLNRNAAHARELRIPPLHEQRRIAHILGTLDDKIELNRRMNETLDEMARAIFKDWFVDFGPARAKMERRDAYLPDDIWKLFPDSLADSELGQIPNGWQVFLLDDVADYQRSSVSPYKQPDTLFEHYSIPAFDKGEQPAADMGSAIKSSKAFVPAGSVLLSKLNPDIPRVWIPNPPSDMKQIASTEFLTFVPRSGIGQGVLYCLFKSVRFRQMLEGMVTGTSRSHQRVPYQALLKSAVISGNPEMFETFDHTVTSLIARMLANRSEVQSLAAMRDTLLPKLVSGEVRVNT